ncbi:MAG: GC-type dockerin domain-anchored protein [Planctomycetota bacterium]
MQRAIAVSVFAAASGLAVAQDSIDLFGVTYDVTRFDYSTITFENPFFPGFDLVLFEVEGTHYLPGEDALIMTTDQLADQSGPSNAIVKIDLVRDGDGVITGLAFGEVIRFVDELAEFDLNVSGVTINTGSTGLAAGGDVVASSGSEALFGFSLADGTLIETSAGCTGFDCGLLTEPFNNDCEDVAYVPTRDEFYTIDQDEDFAFKCVIFDTDGGFLSEFPIGNGLDPAIPGDPKGLTYLADTAANPFGTESVMVALDDVGPGLQAFDLDGTQVGYEPLFDDLGEPLLEVDGFVLQLESLAFDASRGTLFLTNQGDSFTQNFIWILEPTASDCLPDIDGDGELTIFDFLAFQNLFDAGDLAADFDGDGELTIFDFLAFQNAFDAGCP